MPSTAPIPRLTARILAAWRQNAANGLSGRRLPALFADAGMRATTVVAETLTSTDSQRPLRPPFTTMAAVAERSARSPSAMARHGSGSSQTPGERGRFFWALTMFAVGATRA